MHTLQTIVVIAVIIVLTMVLLAFIFQRKLIYYPNINPPQTLLAQAEGMKEVTLHTADKLRLLAWYKPAQQNLATIVYLHGNAGNIEHRLPIARAFLKQGYGVLLVEYRGFGGNPGSPTEKGLYSDAQAAFAFLHQSNIASSAIILYGESLGSGVAVEMATRHKVCALILQSPYTSLPEVARWHYPWIWVKPTDRFSSIDKIASLQAPLLIAHGEKDQTVPYAQGHRLYKKAQQPKQMLSYPNLGHANMWKPFYYQALFSFIEQHCDVQ